MTVAQEKRNGSTLHERQHRGLIWRLMVFAAEFTALVFFGLFMQIALLWVWLGKGKPRSTKACVFYVLPCLCVGKVRGAENMQKWRWIVPGATRIISCQPFHVPHSRGLLPEQVQETATVAA